MTHIGRPYMFFLFLFYFFFDTQILISKMAVRCSVKGKTP